MINFTAKQVRYDQGYVRRLTTRDEVVWALFDEDGEMVHASGNRSSAYFKAADHEISLVLLN